MTVKPWARRSWGPCCPDRHIQRRGYRPETGSQQLLMRTGHARRLAQIFTVGEGVPLYSIENRGGATRRLMALAAERNLSLVYTVRFYIYWKHCHCDSVSKGSWSAQMTVCLQAERSCKPSTAPRWPQGDGTGMNGGGSRFGRRKTGGASTHLRYVARCEGRLEGGPWSGSLACGLGDADGAAICA
jgi:hypothetical protein